MCVAIVVPRDKDNPNKHVPKPEYLIACEESNGHGGGIAWVENEVVRYKKGITAIEIIEIMEAVEPPMFIHFRVASVGGAVPELCHPFPITVEASLKTEGAARAVLMHNGTWSTWKQNMLHLIPRAARENLKETKIPPGPWSDSRCMAWLAAIYGPEILELLEEKIAVLTGRGQWKTLGYGWSEFEGCHYSNLFWKGKLPSKKDEKNNVYYGDETGNARVFTNKTHFGCFVEIDAKTKMYNKDRMRGDYTGEYSKTYFDYWDGKDMWVKKDPRPPTKQLTGTTTTQSKTDIDKEKAERSAENLILGFKEVEDNNAPKRSISLDPDGDEVAETLAAQNRHDMMVVGSRRM